MEQNQTGPAGFDRNRLQNPQSWRRSRSDRWIAGVCGGIGRALNIDPVLVRVVMAVLIISGPGVVFYIAAWILMPDEGSERSTVQSMFGDKVRTDHPWFWPVVVGACVFLAVAMMSSFNFGRFIPGPLIVIGVIWLIAKQRKSSRPGGQGPQQGPQQAPQQGPQQGRPYGPQYGTHEPDQRPQDTVRPSTSAYGGPQPASAYSAQTGPSAPPTGPSSSATQRPQDRTVEPVQPVWTEDDPLGLYVDEPAGAAPVASRPAEPPAKGLRGVKSIIVVLTGLAIGIAALAGAPTATMLIIGLATLGAGMLVGGFVGRTLALLPLGILLAVGALASTVFPSVPRNVADTNYVAPPTQTITATGTSYEFDAGAVRLDLTQAKFAPDAKVDIHGQVGEVVVKLPRDVDVKGDLSAEMGEVAFVDQHRGGHNANLKLDDLGPDGKPGPQQVTLDLDLRLGSIRVERG